MMDIPACFVCILLQLTCFICNTITGLSLLDDSKLNPQSSSLPPGDGRPRKRHVRVLQDPDAAGAGGSPQAPRAHHHPGWDHAGLLPAALLQERRQRHTRTPGPLPHGADRGAAAAPGGQHGGVQHALAHHQALRQLPVHHQRHPLGGSVPGGFSF